MPTPMTHHHCISSRASVPNHSCSSIFNLAAYAAIIAYFLSFLLFLSLSFLSFLSFLDADLVMSVLASPLPFSAASTSSALLATFSFFLPFFLCVSVSCVRGCSCSWLSEDAGSTFTSDWLMAAPLFCFCFLLLFGVLSDDGATRFLSKLSTCRFVRQTVCMAHGPRTLQHRAPCIQHGSHGNKPGVPEYRRPHVRKVLLGLGTETDWIRVVAALAVVVLPLSPQCLRVRLYTFLPCDVCLLKVKCFLEAFPQPFLVQMRHWFLSG